MIGCLVHYGRSYQRVADRVSASLSMDIRKISKDSFCEIARTVPSAKCKSDVLKVFSALKRNASLSDIKGIVPSLCADALIHEHKLKAAWQQASHWSEWWTRLPHLKMLTEVFAVERESLKNATRDTNGVERVHQDSNPRCLLKAMEHLYKNDKVRALSYIAAERKVSLSYRNRTEEGRRNSAASRKCQRLQNIQTDEDSQFGPPDKRSNFCTNKGKGKHLQVDVGQRVYRSEVR